MLGQLLTFARWRQNGRYYAAAAVVLALAAIEYARVQPPEVTVIQQESNVPVVIFGLGQVDAERISQLGFEVDGVLSEMDVQVGDRVPQGALMARLDTRRQELAVASARDALQMADGQVQQSESDLESSSATLTLREQVAGRALQLKLRGAGAVATADDSEAERRAAAANRERAVRTVKVAHARVDQAQAQLDREEATLARHRLLAPYDGIVLQRMQNVGAAVPMGTAVVSFLDPRSLRILAYVDEGSAGMLRPGQPATILLRSRPGEPLAGRIDRIDPRSDRITEERQVYVTFDKPPGTVFLDEQAEVRINVGTIERGLLVPELLVRDRDGAQGSVWATVDGHLQALRLTFGRRLADGRLEVVSPVPANAHIVGQRMPDAEAGMAVRVQGPGES